VPLDFELEMPLGLGVLHHVRKWRLPAVRGAHRCQPRAKGSTALDPALGGEKEGQAGGLDEPEDPKCSLGCRFAEPQGSPPGEAYKARLHALWRLLSEQQQQVGEGSSLGEQCKRALLGGQLSVDQVLDAAFE